MARYKHYEQAVVKSFDERRTVRHSRMPFRGERGVRCEECGDSLPPAHNFAVYGCWCVRCWQGCSLVVVDDGEGHGACGGGVWACGWDGRG